MFINNFDPVAFQIFSFEIRWYSLAYIVGILLGWFLSKKFFISDLEVKEKFDDYLTYLILGLIIGGGTNQIQKNIISERALGMPKEPKVQGA